jgi:hypothetical protein
MRPQLTCVGNEKVPRNLGRWNERNARVLKNISYGSTMSNKDGDMNMSCWKASGTTPGTANTDFTIQHSLGRVPITITGQDTNNGGVLYRSPATPWSKTSITLRCTLASSAYNVIVS